MSGMPESGTQRMAWTLRALYCAVLVGLIACRGDSVAPSSQRDVTRVRATRPSTSQSVERVVYVEQGYDGPVSTREAQAIKRLLDAMPAVDRPSVEQALAEERQFGWRLAFPKDARLQQLLDDVRVARREAHSSRFRSNTVR